MIQPCLVCLHVISLGARCCGTRTVKGSERTQQRDGQPCLIHLHVISLGAATHRARKGQSKKVTGQQKDSATRLKR